MRRILVALVENESGTLSRVADLFSARGYNVESLTVGPTQDPTLSSMTIVTRGNDAAVEKITKQMNKLIEVYRINDITEEAHIERELLLLKVRAEGDMRHEMRQLCEIFRGTIVNVTPKTYVIQIVGDQNKLDAFLRMVGNTNIIEITRSGVCGITRS